MELMPNRLPVSWPGCHLWKFEARNCAGKQKHGFWLNEPFPVRPPRLGSVEKDERATKARRKRLTSEHIRIFPNPIIIEDEISMQDQPQSPVAAFFGTLWGKIIGALTIVLLIVSIGNAINTFRVGRTEAVAKESHGLAYLATPAVKSPEVQVTEVHLLSPEMKAATIAALDEKAPAVFAAANSGIPRLAAATIADIGWEYLKVGQLDKALAAADRALQKHDNFIAFAVRAHVLMLQGNRAEALKIYLGHKGRAQDHLNPKDYDNSCNS